MVEFHATTICAVRRGPNDVAIGGDGQVTMGETAIMKNGATVASIQREFLTLDSRYALEVADPQDALLALCVVLAIDCCDEEHSG